MSTPTDVDRCRYCHRRIGDAFAGGPDDPAPGVCATCINARMAELMFVAARRSQLAPCLSFDEIRAWLREEMIAFGTAPLWADRFVNADIASFAAAQERLHR